MSSVIDTVEWPSLLETLTISAPLAMLSDATTNGAKKITPAATTSLLGTKAVAERYP